MTSYFLLVISLITFEKMPTCNGRKKKTIEFIKLLSGYPIARTTENLGEPY